MTGRLNHSRKVLTAFFQEHAVVLQHLSTYPHRRTAGAPVASLPMIRKLAVFYLLLPMTAATAAETVCQCRRTARPQCALRPSRTVAGSGLLGAQFGLVRSSASLRVDRRVARFFTGGTPVPSLQQRGAGHTERGAKHGDRFLVLPVKPPTVACRRYCRV